MIIQGKCSSESDCPDYAPICSKWGYCQVNKTYSHQWFLKSKYHNFKPVFIILVYFKFLSSMNTKGTKSDAKIILITKNMLKHTFNYHSDNWDAKWRS